MKRMKKIRTSPVTKLPKVQKPRLRITKRVVNPQNPNPESPGLVRLPNQIIKQCQMTQGDALDDTGRASETTEKVPL